MSVKNPFAVIPAGIDNCYILKGKNGQYVMVDAGSPGSYRIIRRAWPTLNLNNLALIVLTHAHADHIGALWNIKQVADIPVAVHESERSWVESGRPPLPPGVTPWGKIMIALAKWLYRPRIKATTVEISFGNQGFSLTEFGIPGYVHHTPGHSPGSSSIVLEDGSAFVGDMAMNAWYLRRGPGLPSLAEDMNQVHSSWQKLINLGVKTVYPAHGDSFNISVIENQL